jgi:hypothetical protein
MGRKSLLSITCNSDQFHNINGWVKYYNKNKTIPSDGITCKNCKHEIKCNQLQLKRLLVKFENNIEKLLVNFTCKECIRFNKEEIRLQEKELQVKKPIEKKVLTWEEIEDRKDEIRKSIPVLKYEKIKPITPKNKEGVEELTKSSCVRPDIYLNNGKYCDGCPWSEYCICRIKRFSKKDIAITRKRR